MAEGTASPQVSPDGAGAGDHDDSRPAWFTIVLVALPTLLILVIVLGLWDLSGGHAGPALQFPDLLEDNTPTGGDTGAHVLLPQILSDSVLPSGRILGWSHAWFAGFPVLYLYFPLPMLTIVALSLVLPYGIAFKIVMALGLLALPTCTFFLVRWLGFARIVAAVAASSAGLFVFMESYEIYGGNIKSSLIGEFAFSWSLALAALYVGLVARDVRRTRSIRPLPGGVLAIVALSHIVSVAVAVLASATMLTRRSAAGVVLGSWMIGFGFAAVWAVPFAVLLAQGMSPDSNWEPVTGVFGSGSPLPGEFVVVAALGVAGAVWSVKGRELVAPLIGLAVIPLALYFLLPVLGVSGVNNARFLPYWYYAMFVLAGIAVGLAVVAMAKRVASRLDFAALSAAVISAFIVIMALAQLDEVPFWVHWGYSGYEGKAAHADYAALMETIDGLPPGRIAWEYNIDIAEYGTPLALMLIPYWSPEHPSMQGLYYESSLTTPFNFINESESSLEPSLRIPGLAYHPMDFDRATRHWALYDVAYYVSYTPEAEAAARAFGLVPAGVARPWVVFRLPESQPVDVATRPPVVWSGPDSFSDAALAWYDDVEQLDHWLTETGPSGWTRVESVGDRSRAPAAAYDVSADAVSNVVIDDHEISFDTTAIGVPHLVKVSYFPNWRAVGADGPYRAAPSLMIVVPTAETVVLRFDRSWSEWLGLIATAIAIAGGGAWAIRSTRYRRRSSTEGHDAR